MKNNILIDTQQYDPKKLTLINRIKFISNETPSILLIHGWGSSHKIWKECIESFSDKFNIFVIDLPGHGSCENYLEDSLESYIDLLIKQDLPVKFSIIGWSVGGIVASFLAKKLPDRVCKLVLIATNLNFLKNENWSTAMSLSFFENFLLSLKMESTEKVLKRFQILQTKGVETAKEDLSKIKSFLKQDKFSLQGLKSILYWLKKYDLSLIWKHLNIPVLHQYGFSDLIVPIETSKEIRNIYGTHQFQIYEKSSHIPFISEKETWAKETTKFLLYGYDGHFINKENISKSFSNIAYQYDQFSIVQKKIGRELLGFLFNIKKSKDDISNISDFGSGTGFFSKDLRQFCPEATLYELDISSAMLNYSASKKINQNESFGIKKVHRIQADIESLPLCESSSDLIFSNLSIQWCKDQEKVFSGIASTLRKNGIAIISTLVDGTFDELRNAWANVDDKIHVNKFERSYIIDLICKKKGLSITDSKIVTYKEKFSCVSDLLQSVKRIGAHNMNAGRERGLLGKDKYKRFLLEFENYKDQEDTYQLTYEVKFLILKKI